MSRAVVFAYHNVGVRCLETLLHRGVEVPLVVTHRDNPEENIWFDSVAALCDRHGIVHIEPDDPNTDEVLERVAACAPEFLFSFYYRHLLGEQMLKLAPRGAFNLHGSLLPKYRGRAPVNWAVLHGERETGATLHEMTVKPDAGRIVDQEAVPIGEDDTAKEVFDKVTMAAEQVLRRALPGLLAGTAALKAQDLSQGAYFGGRKPEDGRIDWSQSMHQIHNLVRAVAPPYPGAFTDVPGHGRLRLLRTRKAFEGLGEEHPALVVQDDKLYLLARDGGLRVLEAELDGRPLDARNFQARFGEQLILVQTQ